MPEPPPRIEVATWHTLRKRIRLGALGILGLCTLALMSGIGLLTLSGFTTSGVILLVLAAVLLLVGMYLNAASRLIRYTDGSSEWEWEKKARENP
jgi:hypothetical protein